MSKLNNTSTKDHTEFYDLLDAGMTTQELIELADEQMYYEYDVTDEVELLRSLNIKFQLNNSFDFGVTDYD